jgi:hypothetical protein
MHHADRGSETQTAGKRPYVKPQLDRHDDWQIATGSTPSRYPN